MTKKAREIGLLKEIIFLLLVCTIVCTMLIPPLSWAKELTWTQRTSPVPTNLRRITYGNGKFVAVGDGSTVLYSDDGTNWAKTVIPGTCNLSGVAYGNGLFVAICGEGFAKVYSSKSGEAWDAVDVSNLLSVGGVAAENGLYLLSGEEVWQSTDGTQWRRVALADEVFGGDVSYRVDAAGISFGNGTFVVVGLMKGAQEAIMYSKDSGSTWQGILLDRAYGLRDVAFENGVFRAIGLTGDILESSDGTSWKKIANIGTEGFGIGNGNGMFIYGGQGIFDDSGSRAAVGNNIWDIAFGKGFFVAVGDEGAIFQSNPVSQDLPLPIGQSIYTFSARRSPFLGDTLDTTMPIGIGTLAEGGDNIELRIMLNEFQGPIDIYLAIAAPDILPGRLFLVTTVGSIIEYKGGLVPWKANFEGIVDESPLGSFAATTLPKGTYVFYLLITPAGETDLTNFALYSTSFRIE